MKTIEPAPPERLYHYTNASGLLGILESRTLWATDIRYLNDAQEFAQGIVIVQDRLREVAKDLESEEAKERADKVRAALESSRSSKRRHLAFVSSLSEDADSLSQWRAYGQDGGYCIGFPRTPLAEVSIQQGFDLRPCVYSPTARIFMDRILNSDLLKWIKDGDNSEGQSLEDELSIRLYRRITALAPTVKDSTFKDEKEWRLISTMIFTQEQRKHRTRSGLIVPYVEIQLGRSPDLWADVEIYVGPTPYPQEAEFGVRDIFSAHHCEGVTVKHSDSPYREI